MHINSRYSIRHRLPPGRSGERARKFINLGRGLSPLPTGRDDAPFIRSITHAPDQTYMRLQYLHCHFDLAAPRRSELLLGSERFSWGFAGRTALLNLHGCRSGQRASFPGGYGFCVRLATCRTRSAKKWEAYMDPSRMQERSSTAAVERRRVHISGLVLEEWEAPRAPMESALLLLIRSTASNCGPPPIRF